MTKENLQRAGRACLRFSVLAVLLATAQSSLAYDLSVSGNYAQGAQVIDNYVIANGNPVPTFTGTSSIPVTVGETLPNPLATWQFGSYSMTAANCSGCLMQPPVTLGLDGAGKSPSGDPAYAFGGNARVDGNAGNIALHTYRTGSSSGVPVAYALSQGWVADGFNLLVTDANAKAMPAESIKFTMALQGNAPSSGAKATVSIMASTNLADPAGWQTWQQTFDVGQKWSDRFSADVALGALLGPIISGGACTDSSVSFVSCSRHNVYMRATLTLSSATETADVSGQLSWQLSDSSRYASISRSAAWGETAAPVPEPSMLALMLSGMIVLGGVARRKKTVA